MGWSMVYYTTHTMSGSEECEEGTLDDPPPSCSAVLLCSSQNLSVGGDQWSML